MSEKNEMIEVNEDLRLPSKEWTDELQLVKEMCAKNCSKMEFMLLLFMARQYGLNPLNKEIWAIKYKGSPAQIFVSRDGLLRIAHRSGQFGNMQTTCEFEKQEKKPRVTFVSKTPPKPYSATCTIWRKDYDKPFKHTVYFSEYNKNQAVWLEKPAAMLMKCAEVGALRRAFNITGVYSPEEMPVDKDGSGIEDNNKKGVIDIQKEGDDENRGTNPEKARKTAKTKEDVSS